MDAEIPAETLSLNEYAESVGVHPRTVKRWLANDEVPAAFRDPFTKDWRFPPGASRMQRAASDDAAPTSFEVAVSGANGQMMVPPPHAWFPHPGEVIEDEPTRLDMLDEESSFLTVERAAKFLGVPQAQIRANAETFGLMPVGINGSLMVPKSTIRRFEGK
jgi:hypothetical protein